MIDDLAEAVALDANDRDLPIVLLGDDGDWGEALLARGERFLATDYLSHLVKAVYIIATWNDVYLSYEFPRGSVVIDPHGLMPELPGVEQFGESKAPDLEGVEMSPEDRRVVERTLAELGE